MKLTLGFSPCPNDTFIFDALVNGKIDTEGIEFEYVMEDVETLNLWAEQGKLDVTKLSYSALLQVFDKYALLESGGALGKGVGPLLITTQQKAPEIDHLEQFLNKAKIAIPGKNTTANLLLTLAYPGAVNKTEVLFSEIEDRVLDGTYDCGLIIHEGRFTYQNKGLAKLMDCGDWWENVSGAAIPLGGIVAKRTLPGETGKKLTRLIQKSLAYSWSRYPELSDFIKNNAQEMEESVMRQHIELYVNDYSKALGADGHKAVRTLFDKAYAAGLIKKDAADTEIYL